MAQYEVRLMQEDLEKDGSPEVLVEFYEEQNLSYVVSVSSSKHNGAFDRVSGDDDKTSVSTDEQALIDLATAFQKLM